MNGVYRESLMAHLPINRGSLRTSKQDETFRSFAKHRQMRLLAPRDPMARPLVPRRLALRRKLRQLACQLNDANKLIAASSGDKLRTTAAITASRWLLSRSDTPRVSNRPSQALYPSP